MTIYKNMILTQNNNFCILLGVKIYTTLIRLDSNFTWLQTIGTNTCTEIAVILKCKIGIVFFNIFLPEIRLFIHNNGFLSVFSMNHFEVCDGFFVVVQFDDCFFNFILFIAFWKKKKILKEVFYHNLCTNQTFCYLIPKL